MDLWLQGAITATGTYEQLLEQGVEFKQIQLDATPDEEPQTATHAMIEEMPTPFAQPLSPHVRYVSTICLPRTQDKPIVPYFMLRSTLRSTIFYPEIWRLATCSNSQSSATPRIPTGTCKCHQGSKARAKPCQNLLVCL